MVVPAHAGDVHLHAAVRDRDRAAGRCARHAGMIVMASTGHWSPLLPVSASTTHTGDEDAEVTSARVRSRAAETTSRARHAATAPSS